MIFSSDGEVDTERGKGYGQHFPVEASFRFLSWILH